MSCSSESSDDSFHSLPALDELLHNTFSEVPKNFNVVHINAQSIPAHYADMLATFDNKNIHAILVSETFLNPSLSSTSVCLPGFQLIRNDRASSSHGGVAIYLRSHIPFAILSTSPQPPPPDTAEHLFLEVTLSHHKLLLGVYYCPSLRIDYFSALEKLLEDFAPSYDHTILMGDFNTCLHKNDSRSSSLRSVINSCNLHILPSNATHHFPNCTPSLLDLIAVSSPELVTKHGQFTADAFSYHDLVYLSYRVRVPKAKPKILLQRNFGAMDLDRLREDASRVDWSVVDSVGSVDEQVELFTSLLTHLYDVHAPVRPVRIRHLPAPWLSNDLRSYMEKKNRAKTRYKIEPSDANCKKYHRIRNRCNTLIRDAQRRHIHTSIENGNPTKIWNFLKSLGV
ncbi:uncharacterized protein LOC113234594, partial [Hyposmocoma kahamanoa]|uniref:uncharacterized protein LOC113234594 n=1 Tax=Hyposmocoma kahamanoa TaxID=1477025 RepID=UPI000E6D7F7F